MDLTIVVNLVTRPASGVLGLVVLPAQGMTKTVKKAFRRTPQDVFRSPRYDMSVSQAQALSASEKNEIVAQWHSMESKQAVSLRKREGRMRRYRPFLTGESFERTGVGRLEGPPAYTGRGEMDLCEGEAGASRADGVELGPPVPPKDGEKR